MDKSKPLACKVRKSSATHSGSASMLRLTSALSTCKVTAAALLAKAGKSAASNFRFGISAVGPAGTKGAGRDQLCQCNNDVSKPRVASA